VRARQRAWSTESSPHVLEHLCVAAAGEHVLLSVERGLSGHWGHWDAVGKGEGKEKRANLDENGLGDSPRRVQDSVRGGCVVPVRLCKWPCQ
jgi:hypothetical protein